MMTSRLPCVTLALLVSAAAATVDLVAQGVPGELPGPGGWAPPSIGVRLGFDQKQRDEILGAQLRLPIIPSGDIELMASADVTFLVNLKEYQYNLEAVYVFDGRAGGLYGGIGLGFRNTVYPDTVDRSTELGYTAVVGFRLVGLGLVVPQLEYRWVVINEAPFTYQALSIGVNLALWRPIVRN